MSSLKDDIKRIIAEHAIREGLTDTGIGGVRLFRATQPVPCLPTVYEPCVVIIASGQNQEIGHLEGGIIREIAVRKGDAVTSGQPLVYLDETQAQADRNRVTQSIVAFSANLARATAELTDEKELAFPENLIERADETGNVELLELQRAEFNSRLQQHNAELNVMEEQVLAIEQEIAGVQLQIEAEKRI